MEGLALAIHRAPRPENHFTQIRNDVLRDERLSYRARGVLAVILSNADDWQTSAEALARAGQEGRDALYTALKELEDVGYLVRVRRQDGRGRFSTMSMVYDQPQTIQPQTIQGNLFDSAPPTTGFQESVNQESVNQESVNQSSVSQESLEHQQEHSVPTEPAPTEKHPADLVADAAYQAMDRMGNYMALRQVAAKALKAGHPPETVTAAFLGAIADGRPCTGQVIHQRLTAQGTTLRETNHDHWTNGGDFAAPEGPTP